MKKIIFMMVAVMALLFTACKKDTPTDPVNPDPKPDTTVVDTPYILEPAVVTAFTYNPETVIALYNDSVNMFQVFVTDSVNNYALCIVANYINDSTHFYGTFNVDSVYTNPGIVWYSTGMVALNDSVNMLMPSYAVATDTAGNIDYTQGVYFITAGSMTITDSTFVANFTSRKGSTFTVNFNKAITLIDMNQPAPSMPAYIRRMFRY